MINKLPVKKLIEFRRLSEQSQATFANNLKIPKKVDPEASDGGNYWTRCTSGVSAAFRDNDNTLVKEKIDAVLSVYETTEIERTKSMYSRNLKILHDFEDFDFSVWRPPGSLKFLSKSQLLLTIKDIPVQVIPHHIFSFGGKDEPRVGGIWFVVWLKGYKSEELGIHSETLFEYLSLVYSKKYTVDTKYCFTVDLSTKQVVSYQQILDGTITSLLQSSIDTLNKYLH